MNDAPPTDRPEIAPTVGDDGKVRARAQRKERGF